MVYVVGILMFSNRRFPIQSGSGMTNMEDSSQAAVQSVTVTMLVVASAAALVSLSSGESVGDKFCVLE